MISLPKPPLRTHIEQLRLKLCGKLRHMKCQRALARSIAAMERDANLDDCIIESIGKEEKN